MPSLAEQDPEEQQDGGCEAHAGEILHRVVWGEGAQVSPARHPEPRSEPRAPASQERMWPQAQPLAGMVSSFPLMGLTAVMGEGVSGA